MSVQAQQMAAYQQQQMRKRIALQMMAQHAAPTAQRTAPVNQNIGLIQQLQQAQQQEDAQRRALLEAQVQQQAQQEEQQTGGV